MNSSLNIKEDRRQELELIDGVNLPDFISRLLGVLPQSIPVPEGFYTSESFLAWLDAYEEYMNTADESLSQLVSEKMTSIMPESAKLVQWLNKERLNYKIQFLQTCNIVKERIKGVNRGKKALTLLKNSLASNAEFIFPMASDLGLKISESEFNELSHLKQAEMIQALGWKIKDRVGHTISKLEDSNQHNKELLLALKSLQAIQQAVLNDDDNEFEKANAIFDAQNSKFRDLLETDSLSDSEQETLNQIEETYKVLSDLQDQSKLLKDLEQKNKELLESLNLKSDELKASLNTVSLLENEIGALKEQILELKDDSSTKEKLISELNKKLVDLELLYKEQEEIIDLYDTENADLAAKLARSRSAANEIEEARNLLEAELHYALKQKDLLEQKYLEALSKEEGRYANLKDDFRQLKDSMTKMKLYFSSAEVKNKEIIESQEEIILNLNTKLLQLEKDLDDSNSRFSELSLAYNQVKLERESLLESLQYNYELLNSSYRRTSKAKKKTNKDNSESRFAQELIRVSRDSAKKGAKIKLMQSSLLDLNKDRSKLESELNALRQSYLELKENYDKDQLLLEEVMQEIINQDRSLKNHSAVIDMLSLDLESIKEKMQTALDHSKYKSETKIKELNNILNKRTDVFEAFILDLTQQLENSDNNLQTALRDLSSEKAISSRLSDENLALQNQIVILQRLVNKGNAKEKFANTTQSVIEFVNEINEEFPEEAEKVKSTLSDLQDMQDKEQEIIERSINTSSSRKDTDINGELIDSLDDIVRINIARQKIIFKISNFDFIGENQESFDTFSVEIASDIQDFASEFNLIEGSFSLEEINSLFKNLSAKYKAFTRFKEALSLKNQINDIISEDERLSNNDGVELSSLEAVNKKAEKYHNYIKKLIAAINAHEDSSNNMMNALFTYENREDMYEDQLNSASFQIAKLKETLRNQRQKIKNQERREEKNRQALEKAEKEFQDSLDLLKEKNKELSTLELKIESLKAEIANLRNIQSAKKKSKQKNISKEQNKDIDNEIKLKEEDLDSLIKDYDQIESELKSIEAEVDRYKDKLLVSTNELVSINDTSMHMKNAFKAMADEYGKEKEHRARLEALIEKKNAELIKIKQELEKHKNSESKEKYVEPKSNSKIAIDLSSGSASEDNSSKVNYHNKPLDLQESQSLYNDLMAKSDSLELEIESLKKELDIANNALEQTNERGETMSKAFKDTAALLATEKEKSNVMSDAFKDTTSMLADEKLENQNLKNQLEIERQKTKEALSMYKLEAKYNLFED